jgi:superfamily II DNA/RNA helicase
MLFSATLDNGVDVLVKRFMHRPVTHAVEASDEVPVEMAHHVLHVRGDDRFGVLVDLLAAPGRSVVFTRTKRRAKVLTKQLVAAGVPAVELHGNLAQNARNRNLAAFSDGSAETLVATDIAARGIHVDDVALVIHADPPVEHKAYVHRSGRTARAGAQGTVVTLMTDDQQAEVRDLTRKAGVRPTTSRTRPGDPLLAQLAPGERRFVAAPAAAAPTASTRSGGRPGRSHGRGAAQPEAAGQGSRGRGQPDVAGQGSRGRGRIPGHAPSQPDVAGQGSRGRGRTRSAPAATSGGGQARTRSAPPATSGGGGAAAFSAANRAGGRRRGGR